MSKDQVIQRMICSEAMIQSQDFQSGILLDADWFRVTNGVNNLFAAPIFIDDNIQNMSEVRTKARQIEAENPALALIIVDCLQLVSSERAYASRLDELGAIGRSCKEMARELKATVLLTSQVPSSVNKRHSKQPVLSDLSLWGDIETVADVVAFIHRPGYYLGNPQFKGDADIIIAKQRNGPTGTVKLVFEPEYARFSNLVKEGFYQG